MAGDLLLVGALLLLVLVAVSGAYLARRRTLLRRVGSFECSARRRQGLPWSPGFALYGAGRLDWYRRHSLAPRPALSWSRPELVVTQQEPLGPERPGMLRVRCQYRATEFELVMSTDAAAGFISWLEASPPQTISPVL